MNSSNFLWKRMIVRCFFRLSLLVTFIVVLSPTYVYAGFLDDLKKTAEDTYNKTVDQLKSDDTDTPEEPSGEEAGEAAANTSLESSPEEETADTGKSQKTTKTDKESLVDKLCSGWDPKTQQKNSYSCRYKMDGCLSQRAQG